MTTISYGEIANQTIRSFLKAVVLIDDHWLDAQNIPLSNVIDPTQLNTDPPPYPPQSRVDLASTSQDEGNSTGSGNPADQTYLQKICEEITNQGILFTGLSYTDALSNTAFKLASKSDILILDWYLGAADSRPALALLEKLKKTGSPRFIFILTDQDLDNVRVQISQKLEETVEGTDLVFSCGPFSFSVKNKPQAGGPNIVLPNQVLDEAIAGIRARFGGLLQLAALELLGQYRDCLHELLDHFHSDIDLPFIMEWFEKNSPIRDSHSFNALAIDEWTARVKRRYSASKARIIKNDTVSAILTDWHKTTTLPADYLEKLKDSITEENTHFPVNEDKVTELVESLGEWMTSFSSCWPNKLKGLKKGVEWTKGAIRKLVMQYLGLRREVTTPIETLIQLDVLFQCQSDLPLKLNQGTVLQNPDGDFLICITPTCDCSQPARIKNCYVFLEAKVVDISNLKKHPEGTVVAIRTKENGNLLLAVTAKPTFTYKISNPLLESNLHAYCTYGAEISFDLKPVAQLRPARVQSLVALAAGKVMEVGLDRSELLRQLCKSNES